jgi:hypothetical protein
MDKSILRKFQAVYVLIVSLILVCVFVPNPEMFQQYSRYELSGVSVLLFYPEDGGQAFLKPGEIYREIQGRCQIFRFIIVMILAVLLLLNGHKASVFACSILFYLIKRFDTSIIAFFLGGHAPPAIAGLE